MQINSGQVAVITGAGSGIGRSLALACASRGMHVLAADIEESAAENTAIEVRKIGTEALALQVDVSIPDQIAMLAETCLSNFGRCDLLCNNAGVSVNKPLAECNSDDWQWVLSVNTLSVGYAINAFLPIMRKQTSGHIVNTASMAGLIPLRNFGAYVASKYAVVGLSEVLAQEISADNIGVSILCPGVVSTRIYESERNRPTIDCFTPTPRADVDNEMNIDFDSAFTRVLSPEEVAEIVLSGVINNNLYIQTHPEWAPLFEQRAIAIQSSFNTQ